MFITSRIYAGYATVPLNPEPYAYEYGFSVKWAIQAQVDQMRGGAPDSIAGNLDYKKGVAPWLAWGPYLWADGTTPRSDGLTWDRSEFQPDGTHPNPKAAKKSRAPDGFLPEFSLYGMVQEIESGRETTGADDRT